MSIFVCKLFNQIHNIDVHSSVKIHRRRHTEESSIGHRNFEVLCSRRHVDQVLYVIAVHDLLLLFLPPEDVVLPEKPKLKVMNKVPNLKKVKKEMKKLRDIQGPAQAANTFTSGQYAIVVSSVILCKHCCLIKADSCLKN